MYALTPKRETSVCDAIQRKLGIRQAILHPTDPFTTLELQNPLHDVPEIHKIRQFPDLEAIEL